MPPQLPPSYRVNVLTPLAQLIGSINRKDQHASFVNTPPVRAFRSGVLEVLSEAWWRAELGQVANLTQAQAIRTRLTRNDDEVGKAWLERRDGTYGRSACLTVFSETILGAAVHNVVVALGLGEVDMMLQLGRVYGTLLQSIAFGNYMFDIAISNHMFETPAGFSYLNGELMSTYMRYFLAPIADLVDGTQNPHVFAPTSLARAFCHGVEAALSKHDWDGLSLDASNAIGGRLQADHAKVVAVSPAEGSGHEHRFTALLGTAVCEAIPLNGGRNVVKLGEMYGALLKSLAYPHHVIHAPSGFSYHNGQPMSTSYELAHRQRAPARSAVMSAHRKAPSYTAYVVDPLGHLMTVIYRADKNVSFRGSAPAKSFRLGVREAVSEEWWAANFRHGDDYLRALAVRDRLQRDEREVRDEWVKRSGGSNLRSFAVQVFCETVVGLAVYKAIVALHLSEDETMSKCGQAYGALLKSLTTPGNYVNAPGGFSYLNGKPISTTFESPSHRQTTRRSSAFFPIARRTLGRW
ncbi:hypothetical protein NBRC10512_002525 [Rhodotorula toruloides]